MATQGLYEISILFTLLFTLFFLTAGWGQIAAQLLGLEKEHCLVLDRLWLGLIFIVAAIGLMHFFIPISWLMREIIIGIGFIGLISIPNLWNKLFLIIKNIQNNKTLSLLLVIALIILEIKSLQPATNFDSGLYHFQTIRWLNEYAIVPGLGNLHGRLAFNQSYFNFLAFLHVQPLTSKGYAAANIFILLLCLFSLYQLYCSFGQWRWWVTSTLALGLGLTLDSLPSPTPDAAIAIIQTQIFIYLLGFYIDYERTGKPLISKIVVITVLLYFIITVKISALFFSIGILIILCPLVWRQTNINRMLFLRTLSICTVLLCVYFVRGWTLSGAPMFPSTFGVLWNLPWTMPFINIRGEAIWIYTWARLPGAMPSDVLGNWSWLSPWLNNLSSIARLTLITIPVLTTINGVMLVRLRSHGRGLAIYSLYLPLFTAFIFWFLTAPDYRFLGAVPMLIISLSGYLCLRQLALTSNPSKLLVFNLEKKWVAYLKALFIIILSIYFVHPRTLTLQLAKPLPIVDAIQKTTNSGLSIGHPKDGICWDNRLPCANFFDENLKLLNPKRGLAGGFTLR